jgi:hypothetical protein
MRIARGRVARKRAVTQSALLVPVIGAAPKAVSIIVITSARIAPA